MPKLTNLDSQIKSIQGRGIGEIGGQKPLTYRIALISICEMHNPRPGTGEGIKAYDLGIKLLNAKGSLELDENEFDFLKEIVGRSSIFVSVIIGRLIHYLDEAQKEKVEQEKK